MDVGYCERYYECQNGKLNGKQCQLGWTFLESLQKCAYRGTQDCTPICPTLALTTIAATEMVVNSSTREPRATATSPDSTTARGDIP